MIVPDMLAGEPLHTNDLIGSHLISKLSKPLSTSEFLTQLSASLTKVGQELSD